MSVEVRALRGLVLERLAAAADDIFALFERTFAQYEEQILRKLLQEPRVVLYKEDIRTVTVGEDISSNPNQEEQPIKNEQEMNPPIKLQYPVPAEDSRPDPSGEQRDGEEPGCSTDLILEKNGQPYSCSDADDSIDWGFLVDTATKYNGQNDNGRPVEDFTDYRDDSHRCTQCPKTFKSTKSLQKHLKVHARQVSKSKCKEGKPKRHMCTVCKRRFSQKRHMSEHMRSHTGETPFSCSNCDTRFRYRYSLVRHILSKHTERKPYSCSVCQKGFVEKGLYEYHMWRHSEQQPFRCSVCEQTYDSQADLEKHECVHKADGEFMS